MYVCMYVCIYVCIYVCMYVCTYIHTYIHTYMESERERATCSTREADRILRNATAVPHEPAASARQAAVATPSSSTWGRDLTPPPPHVAAASLAPPELSAMDAARAFSESKSETLRESASIWRCASSGCRAAEKSRRVKHEKRKQTKASANRKMSAPTYTCRACCVSICTFVPVKQAN